MSCQLCGFFNSVATHQETAAPSCSVSCHQQQGRSQAEAPLLSPPYTHRQTDTGCSASSESQQSCWTCLNRAWRRARAISYSYSPATEMIPRRTFMLQDPTPAWDTSINRGRLCAKILPWPSHPAPLQPCRTCTDPAVFCPRQGGEGLVSPCPP